MNIDKLEQKEPFKNLFPIDNKVLDAIQEHMQDNGYDESQPIITWNNIIIDGNTRYIAAKNIGLKDVPVVECKFNTEEDALKYAIHNQRDRRNMTDADILRCVEALDRRKTKAEAGAMKGNKKLPSNEGSLRNPTSAHKTAEIVGISRPKVERVRTILDHADDDTKQAVLDGEKSIHKAYTETQEKRKHEQKQEHKSVFNRTNDNIEWAQWTWNPVTGCQHNCQYCYARDIANRFYEQGFKPTFHEDRLDAPKNTKVPRNPTIGQRNVFVVSMGDLFGNWVPEEWIEKVLKSVGENKQWNFLFLTKNPVRLLDYKFPKNSWVGTTIDGQSRVKAAQKVFTRLTAPVKFFSCEPLNEEVIFDDLSMVDWIIIGGRSRTSNAPAFQPEWEWVESILWQARKDHVKVYFKPNLETRPKEYPE